MLAQDITWWHVWRLILYFIALLNCYNNFYELESLESYTLYDLQDIQSNVIEFIDKNYFTGELEFSG